MKSFCFQSGAFAIKSLLATLGACSVLLRRGALQVVDFRRLFDVYISGLSFLRNCNIIHPCFAPAMSADYPYLPYLALYIVSASLWSSDTMGATHWILNERDGVVRASSGNDILKSDPVLSILTKTNPPKMGNGRKTNCDQCSKGRSHGVR